MKLRSYKQSPVPRRNLRLYNLSFLIRMALAKVYGRSIQRGVLETMNVTSLTKLMYYFIAFYGNCTCFHDNFLVKCFVVTVKNHAQVYPGIFVWNGHSFFGFSSKTTPFIFPFPLTVTVIYISFLRSVIECALLEFFLYSHIHNQQWQITRKGLVVRAKASVSQR
jgi:hypothetical protein